MRALLMTALFLFALTAGAMAYFASVQTHLAGEPHATVKVTPPPADFDAKVRDAVLALYPPPKQLEAAPAAAAAAPSAPAIPSAPEEPDVVIPGLSVDGFNEPVEQVAPITMKSGSEPAAEAPEKAVDTPKPAKPAKPEKAASAEKPKAEKPKPKPKKVVAAPAAETETIVGDQNAIEPLPADHSPRALRTTPASRDRLKATAPPQPPRRVHTSQTGTTSASSRGLPCTTVPRNDRSRPSCLPSVRRHHAGQRRQPCVRRPPPGYH